MRVYYTECICKDIEDVLRLVYDPECKEFMLEFKLYKYPACKIRYQKMKQGVFGAIFNRIEAIKSWAQCVWWAIKGKPLWWSGNPCIGKKDAKKLAKFMLDSIAGKQAGKEW